MRWRRERRSPARDQNITGRGRTRPPARAGRARASRARASRHTVCLSGAAPHGAQRGGGIACLVRQGARREPLSRSLLDHDPHRPHRDLGGAGAELSGRLFPRDHDACGRGSRLCPGDPAAVDQHPGVHLCLDGAARPQRRRQQEPHCGRRHRGAARAPPQRARRRHRHGARADALHGAADLCRHAAGRSRPAAGGGGARRRHFSHFPPRVPAAVGPGNLCRVHSRVRSLGRLLHHTGAARRRARDHDRRPDRAAGARRAQLVVRERARHRAPGRDDRDLRSRATRDRRARGSSMSTRAARSLHRRARLRRLALGLVCAPIFIFLMLPLVVVFPLSLSSAPYLQFPPPGLSLRWYQSYFGDPVWIEATVRSLVIRATTMLASLAVGMPLAFSLVRGRYWGRTLLDRLAVAPMIVPTIIVSVAIYGIFAKLKLIGAWYGIALAHTILALPFVIIILGAALRGLDESLEQAALGLGASRWQAIRRVTLPEIRPSIVTAAVLAFITSFDELVVAMFLAGPQMTLPKKMFDNIRMEIDPTIAAVSVLQILIITAALLIAQRFGRGATAMGVSE